MQSTIAGLPACHHKYACCEVFKLGNDAMQKRDFLATRIRKKERMNRNKMFIIDLFTTLNNNKEDSSKEIIALKETHTCNTPSYTSSF